MITRILYTLVALLCATCIYSQDYKSLLIGYNQSLPVISEGIGYISADYDGEFLRIEGIVQNLEGNFELGLNGGVALYRGTQGTIGEKIANMLPFVDADGKGFELLEVANRFELTSDEVIALNNNELYINVGTDLHPNGEIRAQIVPQDAEVYYCTLYGSQVTHPYPTQGHGSVLITLLDDTVSVSGSFRDLEGDFVSAIGNANLKSAYLGSDGPALANLTVEADTVANAGIIRNSDNRYLINASEQINLNDGGIYVDIASEAFDRAELRGQATPAPKQLYLANLRSYNTLPASNSRANGKVLIHRNHGDSLYLSGAFQGLESSLAIEFAGGTILYDGRQGQEGSVKELLVPSLSVGNRFGAFHSDDNFFQYLPADLAKLDNHEFYVTIHSEERFNGEIRGQFMPLGQNNFSAVLNEIQTSDKTDSGFQAYIDAVQLGDQITFSGSLLDSIGNVDQNSLSLNEGIAGTQGMQLMNLVMSEDENNNFTIIDASENQFGVDPEMILNQLSNRKSYLTLTNADGENEIIRGQLLPMLQSMYFVPLSDRQEVHHVNSQASGMMILEQHDDSEIVMTGSFENLNSPVGSAITGNILLGQGKYGENGAAFRALVPSLDAGGQSGEIESDDNRFFLQNSRADSLQVSGLYVNVLTEDEEDGEIRGQILEIADAYYNTRLDAVNVIKSSIANGTGQALMMRKGQQLIVNGSFSGLDGVVNFSNNGGVAVRSADIDENGDIKFLLFPDYAVDSLSGTFGRQNNTLFLGGNDLEDLRNENLYLELRKTSQEGPALRGQIQLYKNVSPTEVVINLPIDRDTIVIDGLETDEINFSYESAGDNNTVSIKISDRPDFLPTLYAENFGVDETVHLNYKSLDSLLLNSSVSIGDTLRLYYRIVNSDGADFNEGELRSMYLVRGLVTGVPDLYRAQLTANHSMPPRQSTAYGDITAELLDTTLRIRGELNNLMGDFVSMNVHMGMAGSNGTAVFELDPIIQPDGSIELTTFDNTFALSESLLDTLNDRGLYINVTSTLFPSGEVRGQILPEADAYYYANLMGSNVLDAYATDALGALSIEVRDGSMTVTGTYNNLDSPYNFDIQGGSHLKLGLPGEVGPSLFSLVPIELDSVNGVYQAQNNTFDITDTDITILNRRSLYADIHTDDKPDGALRGAITPILRGTFRSNLQSLHHRYISNDNAKGVMQVELNVDNSIVIYGSFSELPNSTNDFEGLMQYGYGFDSEERNILSLNAKFDDQDSISGTLLVESNTVTVNDTVVQELLHRSHYINIDLQDGYGGIRGQVLGLAQQYYSAKLNGYQMMPSQGGGEIKSVFMEKIDNQIIFSGAVSSESSSLSVNQEVIGKEGTEIISFNGIALNDDYLLNPFTSSIPTSGTFENLLNNQGIYIQHNNAEAGSNQRGQVISNARYIHLGLPSGIGQLFSIDTEAEGRTLLVSNWDGTYSFTGAVRDLSGGLDENQSGGLHLHFNLPGRTSDIETILDATLDNGVYTIEDTTLVASELFESLVKENKLYFDAHSIDYPNGEIRSQLRPLANYYYTATLNGQHAIDNSDSPAQGKINLDLTADKGVYYGSYNNLSFPIGDESETSQIGFNDVFEPLSAEYPLSLVKSNSTSGEWNAIDNIYRFSQSDLDELQNNSIHLASSDIFDNVAFRGRFLEEVNAFADPSSVLASVPSDTLLIEGDLNSFYSSSWTAAIDDEALMYKYQLSLTNSFVDVIYEQNAADQNEVTYSFVQLQSALNSAGVMIGDTIELFQRVYITDGSEDVFSATSSFIAVSGVVQEPIELYRAYLSGYQEKSPVVSRGQGFVELVLQGNVLTVEGSFDNMEGALANVLSGGAHIQIGLAGDDGPIMHSLDVDTGVDGTSGVINEFDNIFELTEAEIAQLRNRSTYINIYSERYSTGELRGQILPLAENYFLSAVTASQSHDAAYSLDGGQFVIEVYSDSIFISGSVDHTADATYGLYVGLAGLEGQKIIDLNPIINIDNDRAFFNADQNSIENTPGLLALLSNREVYISTEDGPNNINLRGQVLPEIKSAFYSNLSGLKTVSISNSLSQGRMITELGKTNSISISGSVSNLEGLLSDMILYSGLPGQDGAIVNTLIPTVGSDMTEGILTAQNNTYTVSAEILEDLVARELYLQANTENETVGEVRGQCMALAPMYAESVITGSQISSDVSSQAHGLIEMEIHPQEINALGSVTNLPLEIEEVEYINMSSALDGPILRSMIWDNPADGVVTMSIEDNQQIYSESLIGEIESNRVSVIVRSPEHPSGAARGILMPPAQGLYIAPLSSAALTERTDNPGAGTAMLILRNDTEVKFVAGVVGIPTNSLRFRFGKGLPAVVDENPFNYLGFQPTPMGVIFNNNNVNNFTDQIISDIRSGLHHVKISSNTNNAFIDHVRGQIMPIGYQSYQGTFTNYHPQGATSSLGFGKIKATLNGTVISIEGHTTIDDSEVNLAWIGIGGVNEDGLPVYPVEITGQDILMQRIETFGGDDLVRLANKEMYIVIATDEFPDGAIRAQLMPDINYYPSPNTIDTPLDNANIVLQGDSSQLVTIEWTEIESPDDLKYVWELSEDENFEEVLLRVDRGDNNFISFTYDELDSLLRTDLGLVLGDDVNLFHRVVTTDGSEDTYGQSFGVTITIDEFVNVDELVINGLEEANLLPNITYHGQSLLMLNMSERKELTLEVISMNGVNLLHQNIETQIGTQHIELSMDNAAAGKYKMVLRDEHGAIKTLDWIIIQ